MNQPWLQTFHGVHGYATSRLLQSNMKANTPIFSDSHFPTKPRLLPFSPQKILCPKTRKSQILSMTMPVPARRESVLYSQSSRVFLRRELWAVKIVSMLHGHGISSYIH